MIKLEKLISNVSNDPGSTMFFNGIMTVNKGTLQEYYIDPRTWRNPNGLNVVTVFCYHNSEYWYICPDCGQIHRAFHFGKSQTGCCMDIDCQRHQYAKGEHVFVQRDPVILQDEE